MTKLEGNVIIAEFMELDVLYENMVHYESCLKTQVTTMKYHTSWDWLMPVIGKISNQCEEPEELDPLKYALLTDNIEEAWIFVVDYLKDKKDD